MGHRTLSRFIATLRVSLKTISGNLLDVAAQQVPMLDGQLEIIEATSRPVCFRPQSLSAGATATSFDA